MRCDQYIGLNDAALLLIGDACALPSGRSFTGMFSGVYDLYRYEKPDGRVLEEYLQAEPWSSGPCFFIALKDEAGNWVPESLWPESEIEAA